MCLCRTRKKEERKEREHFPSFDFVRSRQSLSRERKKQKKDFFGRIRSQRERVVKRVLRIF
jgi:hypothetical protein